MSQLTHSDFLTDLKKRYGVDDPLMYELYCFRSLVLEELDQIQT